MAAKKWPKWLVGFSSVASFTGFLFLIQHPMNAGTAANGAEANAANNTVQPLGDLVVNTIPQPEPISVKSGTSVGDAKTFLHSRAEFQQIKDLSSEKKTERELQLEQLDWDGTPDNATVVAPIKTVATPAKQQPAAAQQTTVATPKPKQVTTVPTPAPTPKPKSDVKTRRS